MSPFDPLKSRDALLKLDAIGRWADRYDIDLSHAIVDLHFGKVNFYAFLESPDNFAATRQGTITGALKLVGEPGSYQTLEAEAGWTDSSGTLYDWIVVWGGITLNRPQAGLFRDGSPVPMEG